MNHREPALIPRRILFGNPDYAAVSISPDGERLMWLAPLQGVLNIWVAPRDNPADARVITHDKGRGIRSCAWSFSRDHVVYLQDRDGDENWRLYAVDLSSAQSRELTPLPAVSVRFLKRSPNFPQEVVVGLNHRNPQWHDIYRINIIDGQMTLLLEHEQFSQVLVDGDFRLRFAISMTEERGALYYRRVDDDWQEWDVVGPEDMFTTGIAGFGKQDGIVYFQESRERNTSALMEVNLNSNARRLLAEDSRVDVAGLMRHPVDKQVQAVAFVHERKRWQVLDPSIAGDLQQLSEQIGSEFGIGSRSQQDRFWVVHSNSDDAPTRFYLYDRQNSNLSMLFSSNPPLEDLPLVKMHSLTLQARDGLELVAYYSLPAGSDNQSAGIPDQPLPLVFTPHGGPWARDFWGFHPWHQWLANRGYAVLSVNFRSSTGFGKDFINAGDCEWGGKIIEDQQDAVHWAIDSGIADPEKIAVLGGSFGGYSVLAGLTFTPQLFACGVDQVGVANLITWLDSIPPYWKPYARMLAARVGDPTTAAGRRLLEAHSPLNHVGNICKPLLVAQGANDPRVTRQESDQIVAAMQENAIPVTYLLYPDEGHGFIRPENNQLFYAIVEAFLAAHIGGRLEPLGDELEASSAELLAGIDQIPGLGEALSRRGKS